MMEVKCLSFWFHLYLIHWPVAEDSFLHHLETNLGSLDRGHYTRISKERYDETTVLVLLYTSVLWGLENYLQILNCLINSWNFSHVIIETNLRLKRWLDLNSWSLCVLSTKSCFRDSSCTVFGKVSQGLYFWIW